VAVRQSAEVELDSGLEAPVERHLVDAHRGPAAGDERVIHGGEVVVGRVEVRAVVGADGAALDGGVLAAGQLVDAHAHEAGHGRGGHVVVEIVDLREHFRRVAGDAGLEGDRDVHDAPRHGRCPPAGVTGR